VHSLQGTVCSWLINGYCLAVTGKMSTRAVSIDGLSDKESFISDAWTQLYQLMQSAAQQLQWKTGRLFHSEGSELASVCFLESAG